MDRPQGTTPGPDHPASLPWMVTNLRGVAADLEALRTTMAEAADWWGADEEMGPDVIAGLRGQVASWDDRLAYAMHCLTGMAAQIEDHGITHEGRTLK